MIEPQLRDELANLHPVLRARLNASGFDAERLVALAAPLSARRAEDPDEVADRNRVRGAVVAPRAEEISAAPDPGTDVHDRLTTLGLEAIGRGEVALCVLAGGMATRMGGVVKALVEAFDGHTFLDLRLRENATWSERAGRPVPLWLMTSESTDAPIREALASRGAPPHVATFTQELSVRVTPDGRLFLADDGQPSTYAPGHGDLPDALRRSGLLSAFVARGGNVVWIANLDNLGASIDPLLLGTFLDRRDVEVLVEVAPKSPGDRGGIPVWVDGKLQVLEEFRLPRGFDAANVAVFNTNTFLVRAEPLQRAPVRWNFFEVQKTVGGRVAVQFERLLQELTAALPSGYVRVPREGLATRFLPVKDFEELEKRREHIRAVARDRSMI